MRISASSMINGRREESKRAECSNRNIRKKKFDRRS